MSSALISSDGGGVSRSSVNSHSSEHFLTRLQGRKMSVPRICHSTSSSTGTPRGFAASSALLATKAEAISGLERIAPRAASTSAAVSIVSASRTIAGESVRQPAGSSAARENERGASRFHDAASHGTPIKIVDGVCSTGGSPTPFFAKCSFVRSSAASCLSRIELNVTCTPMPRDESGASSVYG